MMRRFIYILTFAALAIGAVSCTKEEIKEEKTYSSVIKPDFEFAEKIVEEGEDKNYIASVDDIKFINKSSAEGTEITGYFWHYGYYGYGSTSREEEPSVKYVDSGTYTVTLTVYGADGNKASVRKVLKVIPKNATPLMSFKASTNNPGKDEEVTFTSTSYDVDGTIVSYSWSVGDAGEEMGTEEVFKYTFDAAGSINVTLKVTDDYGNVGTLTKSVYVLGGGNGNGTPENPWIIKDAAQWNSMAADMNKKSPKTYRSSHSYILTQDIDFSGKSLTKIKAFSGVLDGREYKLTGISQTFSAGHNGLIGENTGIVRNLTVEVKKWTAETPKKNSGYGFGVVGRNYEGGVIDGVFFKGDVKGVNSFGTVCGKNERRSIVVNSGYLGGKVEGLEGNDHVSGLVGYNYGGYIVNCFSWADEVKGIGCSTGAIAGYAGSDGCIINCYGTCEHIMSGGSYEGTIGYCKVHNIQNIYGPDDAVIGHTKSNGSVWSDYERKLSISLKNMKEGKVVVPSSGEECKSFVDALNMGITIYNSWEYNTKPEGITLRAWSVGANGYPSFAE